MKKNKVYNRHCVRARRLSLSHPDVLSAARSPGEINCPRSISFFIHTTPSALFRKRTFFISRPAAVAIALSGAPDDKVSTVIDANATRARRKFHSKLKSLVIFLFS